MERLKRPTPKDLPVKIITIGAGGLQRALTHKFVDELNQRGIYKGGIFIGQPRGVEKVKAFNRQDGLYHVATFDMDGIKKVKLVSSVIGTTTLSTEEGEKTSTLRHKMIWISSS